MKPNCSTAAAPHVQYAKTRGFRRDSETSFGRTAISVPGLPTIRAHLHRTLSQSVSPPVCICPSVSQPLFFSDSILSPGSGREGPGEGERGWGRPRHRRTQPGCCATDHL